MKIMKKCYNKSVTCWLILILFCLCSCNNTEKWVNKNSFEEDTGNVFSENKSSEEIIKLPNGNSTVSLGARNSAVITDDGNLYTWGYNKYGQLGNGTTENSEEPIKIMENVMLSGN